MRRVDPLEAVLDVGDDLEEDRELEHAEVGGVVVAQDLRERKVPSHYLV